MNYIKFLTNVILLLCAQIGCCCINEYRTLLSGKVIYADVMDMVPPVRYGSDDKAYQLKQLHEADSIYRKTGKIEDYSDMGSMLVYAGQYLKAKQVFLDIERKSPGRYQTAANLGTTYELIGQNDSALYWIKRAVAINPESHSGSEWIHVKILEAKLKANGDEKYLWTHSILALDFGNNLVPVNNTGISLEDLRSHLYDQLHERMYFVKPKDPIVAQLLFDLGNVCAMSIDPKSGSEVFQAAKEYGYTSDLLYKRQAYFDELQSKADVKNHKEELMYDIIGIVIAIVLGVIALIVLYKRIQKRA